MPSPSTLAAFALAALLLILLPGPSMLFLVARGVAGGRRAGVVSALGIQASTAVYVVATALGLTAVLAASTLALSTIRYAGAAYLVYLGVRTLLDRSELRAPSPDAAQPSAWASWRQGFTVGISNPKVALFFLAFFPQFVHPEVGPVAIQVLVLGGVIIALGMVFDLSYGAFGGLIQTRMGRGRGGLRPGRVAVGLTYIGLGGLTAVTAQRAL